MPSAPAAFHEIFELAPLFVWNVLGEAKLTAHNLIQGNSVVGAEGVGLVIMRSSHTRVVSNTFEGVASSPHGAWLGAGNGSGVWVSPGSSDNRILANSFASVESYAVVLEGDHNHVATTSASHSVLDLGADNRVSGPGSIASVAVTGSLSAPGALVAVTRSGLTSAVGRQSIAAGRVGSCPAERRALNHGSATSSSVSWGHGIAAGTHPAGLSVDEFVALL